MFASDEWCTIPFLEIKKNTLDRINDIILHLPECFAIRTKLRNQRNRSEPSDATRRELEAKALWLAIRLEEYWKEYGDDIDDLYSHEQYYEVSDFQGHPEDWIITSLQPVTFRDTFAATNIPDYDAAVMLAHTLLMETFPESLEVYNQRIAIHCESILQACAFHQKVGLWSGGDVSMVFALKSVEACTPSRRQRGTSAEELAKWGATRGVAGICKLWRREYDAGIL